MTIGTGMSSERNKAFKALAFAASVFVYAGMLVYTGVHNYTLMTRGVRPDLVVWAIVGVLALELSATALPLTLHYWTFAPMQRLIAFVFYGVDLALIVLNVILDFALNAGTPQTEWMQLYFTFGVPVVPIVAGLGWALLWLLDPGQRERATIEGLKAAARQNLAARIIDAANAQDVTALVEATAAELTREVVGSTMAGTMADHGVSGQPKPTKGDHFGPAAVYPVDVPGVQDPNEPPFKGKK